MLENEVLNPLESLQIGADLAQIEGEASLSFEPWRDSWPRGFEIRRATIRMPFTTERLGSGYLSMQTRQKRDPGQPGRLLNAIGSIVELNAWGFSHFEVGFEFGDLGFSFVAEDTPCRADSLQGELANMIHKQPARNYTRKPLPQIRSFESVETDDAHDLSIQIEGLSSYGSAVTSDNEPSFTVDKTEFIEVTKASIHGLFDEPLQVTAPGAAVYAPSHHNFTWQYAIDLMQADNLSAASQSQLQSLGGRYLVFPLLVKRENFDGQAYWGVDWQENPMVGLYSEGGRLIKTFGKVKPVEVLKACESKGGRLMPPQECGF